MLKKIFWLILLLTMFGAKNVKAQENSLSLAISPAIVEKILSRGETISYELNVFNRGNGILPIKISVNNFESGEENQVQSLASSVSWTKVEPENFLLKAGEGKVIKVNILVPKDAEPGGSYATIYFIPLLPEAYFSKGAVGVPRLAVEQLLVVKGEIVEKGKLLSLKTGWLGWSGVEKEIEMKIENLGNVHSQIGGWLEVENRISHKIDKIGIKNAIVLPGEKKRIIEKIKIYLPGLYWLRSQVAYGVGQKIIENDVRILWVLPNLWQVVLFGLLTIVGIFSLINLQRIKYAFLVILKKYDTKNK